MGMVVNIKQEIVEIFKNSQNTAATHQKNCILLKKLYEKSDLDDFFEALQHPINIILKTDFKHRNLHVEKLIEFIGTFCSLLKPNANLTLNSDTGEDFREHPLVTKIFDYLLETSQLVADVIRFRSCQIINKILDHMVGVDVSDVLCENIRNSLLIRLRDPKNVIRLQAIIALFRLQDPTDKDDEVLKEFIGLIRNDGFAKVRQLCIEKVAARRDVIPHIITRIRDVDVHVRLSAYMRLTKFAQFLKIVDKRLILKCGSADSSDKIKDFVSNTLLNCWLEYYNNDILKLMESIRLNADENDVKETSYLVEYILSKLFKSRSLKELSQVLPVEETKLLPFENLNWEVASYWRIYVEFLSSHEYLEEELNKVLPELVDFCNYIKDFCRCIKSNITTEEFLEKQYIIKQFFLFTKIYDFADPTCRQCLNSLVFYVTENTVLMSDVIEVIISNLEHTIPNVENRSIFVNEIISELISPLNSAEAEKLLRDKELEVSKLKVKLNCLVEDQKVAIEKQQYIEAERIKHELEIVNASLLELRASMTKPERTEKKSDIPTIIKYLDIACGLLLSPQINKLTPALISLKDNIIQELLIHDNDNVRSKALRCYALCCILDKSSGRNGIHIFSTPILAYKAGEECDTHTLIVCINAVVDLLRIYGSQLMVEPDEDLLSESMDEEHQRVFAGGTSLTDLIQGLVVLMDDEQYEIQETAGIGLCKLVLSERIHSSALISRLVIKWCTPASDECDSDRLKQCIGFILEQIPLLPDCIEQLEGAVLTTVKALAYAPKVSPLADVNIDNIAKFMVALCKISPQGSLIHSNLATTICVQINDKPRNRLNNIYSKILLMLDIPDDRILIRDLLKICEEIKENVSERFILANITKYAAKLIEKNLQMTEQKEETEEERNYSNIV